MTDCIEIPNTATPDPMEALYQRAVDELRWTDKADPNSVQPSPEIIQELDAALRKSIRDLLQNMAVERILFSEEGGVMNAMCVLSVKTPVLQVTVSCDHRKIAPSAGDSE